MTLKEILDEKLPPLYTIVWNEIKELFLELDEVTLAKGVTISIYRNNPKSHCCYLVDSVSDSKCGIPFSHDFDVDTFKKVIDIAEENGIVVEPINEDFYYKFIYTPTWK